MHNRKKTILVISLISAAMLFAFVAFKPKAQNRIQQQEDPPTPVQIGVRTERQKKHGKRFEKVQRNGNLLSDPEGVMTILYNHPDPVVPAIIRPTQAEYFKALTCGAELVVIAKVTDKDSQFTENLNFIFTDYNLNIEQILKNNTNFNIESLNNITLNTSGGSVRVNNRIIKYEIANRTPIHIGGQYLLFLDYSSDSEVFKLSHDRGIFVVLGNKIKTPERQYVGGTDNIFDIINLIQGIAINCLPG